MRTAVLPAPAAAALLALVALTGLGACATGGGPAATPTPASAPPTGPAPAQPPPATPGLPADPGPAITSPSPEQLDRLVTAAASIKPGLVENADTLARRADSTCLDLREGADPAAVVSDVQRRFSGGGADGLTEDEAARLAEAIRSTVCP